jgi:putative RNA 2'-phosphotransferase
LYHGTPNRNVDSILKEGINRGNRHHVHLSKDEETAASVGSRRGAFTILKIEALRMRADGHKIYISDNGVYLVDEVPSKYISI